MIIESIWEEDLHEESVGYRPGRGARQSSCDRRETLNGGTYRWIVEADIRSFFDHMDHDWLVRMLEQRIADRGLIALIVKWLNRRSERRSMTWTEFSKRLKHWDLPLPRIVEKPVQATLPSGSKPA